MIGGEDDPRLVDKNVPDYVPDFMDKVIADAEEHVHMEDAPGLVDSTFMEYIDLFISGAEMIYQTLEAEDHRHFYKLLGKTVDITIQRLPRAREENDKRNEDHGQNEKVGKEEGDKSKRESEEESSNEAEAFEDQRHY